MEHSIVQQCNVFLCSTQIKIFLFPFRFQLDTDRDGVINIRELKNHIRNFPCRNLPEYLANHILRMSDEDSDGVLDFEEFYRLSLRQDWLFSRLVFNYCKMLVPSPHRPEQDETGKQ